MKGSVSSMTAGAKTAILGQWRTKGQNQNKNQREGNTPPPPIAILLVVRKPKN
jgi:hypothetical protein